MFFKNPELHKKYKKHDTLIKKEATEGKVFFVKKINLLILKILLTRRKISLNILARLIEKENEHVDVL